MDSTFARPVAAPKAPPAASERQRQCNLLRLFAGVHNRTVQRRGRRYLWQMSISIVSAVEQAHATRWREWQVKNEEGQRHGVRRARLAFTLIFIALGLWFGVQLVS